MAIAYNNDLYYNRSGSLIISDLISVYNPNVLLFYSNKASTDASPTAEVEIVSAVGTYTFEAVFIEKDASNRYQFRLDLSDILPSLMEPFITDNERKEIYVQSITPYENADSYSSEITINITVDFSDVSDDTDSNDYVICRSVNQLGDEGGANLYSIYSTDTRPTYHIWDNILSQIGVYLVNPQSTTTATFTRAISTITASSLDPGFHRVRLYPDMTDEKEQLLNGDFSDWTGSIPDEWSVVNTDTNNTITESSNKVFLQSNGTKDLGLRQDFDINEGALMKVGFQIVGVSDDITLVISDYDGSNIYYSEVITVPSIVEFNTIAKGTGLRVYLSASDAAVLLDNVSAEAIPFNMEKQTVQMTINDDYDTRYADIIIHKGCDDGVNVRYMSRDYAIRYWQFNQIKQVSSSAKEVGRVINNIDDMTEETNRYRVIGYDSTPKTDCVYVGATVEEQEMLMDIYSSPMVQVLINDVWTNVFPSGRHTINNKKSKQNFYITFEMSQEYTQEL